MNFSGYLRCVLNGAWLGIILAATGCKSPPPMAEGSLAWVEITNHTPLQILAATKAVFVEKGYRLVIGGRPELVFEKPGGFTNGLLHGGLDSGVVLRVFVGLDNRGNGAWLLHCRADAVRDAGQALEESQRLSRLHSGSLQRLLVEVKTRLPAS